MLSLISLSSLLEVLRSFAIHLAHSEDIDQPSVLTGSICLAVVNTDSEQFVIMIVKILF